MAVRVSRDVGSMLRGSLDMPKHKLANAVGKGLSTLCPPRLGLSRTVAVDKAWTTRQRCATDQIEGRLFVSPGRSVPVWLDRGDCRRGQARSVGGDPAMPRASGRRVGERRQGTSPFSVVRVTSSIRGGAGNAPDGQAPPAPSSCRVSPATAEPAAWMSPPPLAGLSTLCPRRRSSTNRGAVGKGWTTPDDNVGHWCPPNCRILGDDERLAPLHMESAGPLPANGAGDDSGPSGQVSAYEERAPTWVAATGCFVRHQFATVISRISSEPVWMLPRRSMSSPQPTMPLNMSSRLPAMVTSSTGWLGSPFSIQIPDAPRE